jgi:hypothetical protein
MIQLRRKRGKNYLDEVRRTASSKNAPLRIKAVSWIRLWHFTVTPKLVVVLFLLGMLLLLFNQWSTVLFAFLIFLLSSAALIYSIHTKIGDGIDWMRLVFAFFKLFFVTLLSMLTLKKNQQQKFQSD